MSKTRLKFKVQSLKAAVLATLNFKLCTALYLRSWCYAPPLPTPPLRRRGTKNFAFICVFFFFPPVFAEQPTIRDLDRMFTTRYERAQLDALRARMSGAASIEIPTAENNVRAAPVNVEMQGIMQREKGKTVTWINGQNTLNNNTISDHIRVTGQPQALRGANVAIDGQAVRLKPGQVWKQETGEVVEGYKTKVAAPVIKGAGETEQDVQTGGSESNQATDKPPVTQP